MATKSARNASTEDYLTRAEAVAHLDVKPATLYTYVSRGLIRRVRKPGTKRSLYYKEDVRKVRSRSEARSGEGVVAASAIRYGEPIVPTSVTEITAQGPRYRGRPAVDLVNSHVPFEVGAELLWTGLLRDEYRPWTYEPILPEVLAIAQHLGRVGSRANIHDHFAMLTLSLGMGRGSPHERINEIATPALAARQLIAALTGCFGLLSKRRAYRSPVPGESIAQAVATSLGVRPSPEVVRALDAALTLSADHELNPATFVARIAASSEVDLHSCVASAICTQSGARIARACDRLEAFFDDMTRRAPAQRGKDDGALGQATIGFNHPLYPDGDPRASCLLGIVSERNARSARLRGIQAFLDSAARRSKLHPRFEMALAVLAIALRLPRGSAAGLYTLGRIAGLVAHITEQRLAGFLIRPRAKFSAPGS